MSMQKWLLSILIALPLLAQAQAPTLKVISAYSKPAPDTQSVAGKNWYQLPVISDSLYGAETEHAWAAIPAGKTPHRVIVAVIDAGVEIIHEDLAPVIWTNAREIPGNNIDDDKNGYVDDVHGWNYLGAADGTGNMDYASKEADREYLRLKTQYAGRDTATLSAAELTYFRYVRNNAPLFKAEQTMQRIDHYAAITDTIMAGVQRLHPGKALILQDLLNYNIPAQQDAKWVMASIQMRAYSQKQDPATPATVIMAKLNEDFNNNTRKAFKEAQAKAQQDFRASHLPGNSGLQGLIYGNDKVGFRTSGHGTLVSGIIGATRDNHLGVQGIASVTIMPVRTVFPGGDEFDEDVAHAIRYAVDNGAQIINMSFGKRFSPDKKLVDEAIQYAEKKNVLIVHGAGNDNENTDSFPFYPAPVYLDGKKATNLITVGATDSKGRKAGFSSYGKRSVDLFAPGVHLYSTFVNNSYAYMDGTSVAAPVVTGIAALLLTYYPTLKPAQVKDILLKTVTPNQSVLGNISVSGGIVNAYRAMQLAQQISK